MKNEITFILKNEQNRPLAVLCLLELDSQSTAMGLSILGEGDRFNYKFGIDTARERAIKVARFWKNWDKNPTELDWSEMNGDLIIRERAFKSIHRLNWEDFSILNRLFNSYVGHTKAEVIDEPFISVVHEITKETV